MSSEHHVSAPLLHPRHDSVAHSSLEPDITRRALRHLHHVRRKGRVILSSRKKHYLIMLAVTLDVMTLLANVFIKLIACEMHQNDEEWVKTVVEDLELLGLVFSSLFVLELAACLFSFGLRYRATICLRRFRRNPN